MKLQPTEGRVIVSIDGEKKNSHRFENGMEIRLERNYDNLNRREVAPVNAIVIAAANIPAGSEIIIHHNANHPTNELFNYQVLDGSAIASNIKYYSIPEYECYLYRLPETSEWLPFKGFETALRVFEPYNGILAGIKPTRLKNRLLITSGQLKGKVCVVAHASDYCMVFQGIDGREQQVIRIRHFEEPGMEREEILGLDHALTEKWLEGEIQAGLNKSDCKNIYEFALCNSK